MNADTIYQAVCRSGDTRKSLEDMPDATLAVLITHLQAAGIESGVPGIVTGLAETEAARRWVAQQLAKGERTQA